ncbi:ABC transporter substrate-binding protein [Spirulina sp. 06S082]|uniref:ABC transporter substrate-binding protein n=1 Tax=Spirulina sp. 06S082 TaxID=3110248 RepID=UPI002B210948|nr:extracellular solute-binding protein [Spirulina sp. 06S082]MEA5471966.1 extracellular solute-binding protein [Spirulina sp. 06S082]
MKTREIRKSFFALGLAIAFTACTSSPQLPKETVKNPPSGQSAPISEPRFDNVKIAVLTRDLPTIAEPIARRAKEFTAKTGAEIEVITVPFEKLYGEIQTNLQEKSGKYDVMVFAPQWLVDYAELGELEDLGDRIAQDSALQWEDIAPFFRNFSTSYKGKTYTIPLDGDFQMVYYRTDLLTRGGFKPPETWEDYLAIAKHFQQQDLNADGTPDYGSCIPKKRGKQSYWMFWSIASAFLQSQGTEQGAFFDPDTMKPLVNNKAFAKALEIYKETGRYAPDNELELDIDETRNLFISGRCALTLDWGDIGPLAIDSKHSEIGDRLGAVILPGTTKVLDRATGELVVCNDIICPYEIEGINRAPYAAFGGWSGAINAASDAKTKDAAYAFLSYVSQPAQSNQDVTLAMTGFNPYRISQFSDREAWIAAGMSLETTSRYLGAIGFSLRSPNVVLDLRIPQNHDYQQEILDTALADFLEDKITTEQTMQQIYQGWENLTNKIGRESQKIAYRSSLGL